MKLYSLFLGLFFQSIFLIPITYGQSWEILFENPALDQGYLAIAMPSQDNGVRVAFPDPFVDDPTPIFSFDAFGNYIGQSTIGWTSDWEIINADHTGASYWVSYYKLRKLTANNQIAWTYSPPVTAGIFWDKPAPNGGNCLQYNGNSTGKVIDYINTNGQLVNRFQFSGGWPDNYYPGHDHSLIYTDESSGPSAIHWVKVNQFNQVVWELDLDPSVQFLAGSLSDGSTFYYNYNILTKLNANGIIEWQRNVQQYFPASDFTDFLGMLVRQDGSIIVATGNSDFGSSVYKPHFTNINPANGDPIWVRQTANATNYARLFGPMVEMSDGGILACFGPIWGPANDHVLIVRTDPNGNTLTNHIAGKIYWDQNYNCLLDAAEKALKQVSVIAQSGAKKYSATSDADGNFSMATTGGEYTISIAQPGSYWNYCGFPNPLTMQASNDTVLLNIGAKATIICPEMFVSIGSPVFRRCFDNNYLTVQYQNLGTAAAINAYVSVTLDPKLIYLSSTAPLLSQNGQTYNFDISTVDIGESGFFTIQFKVDCDATLGEILCVDTHVYPDTLCIPTAGARVSNRFCLPAVASYDPNDKTAFVDGKPQTTKILPDSGLEYLIRFQNTGNDTAFNIVIADTLSQRLDPASVVPGASSHPYFFELRDGKVLRFVFNNILLPDSTTNEPASHGFVKFYIRQNLGNPIGATLSNTAAIFFDFNLPVITNESKLVISTAVRTNEPMTFLEVKTWPVPAHDRVEVLLPDGAPAIRSWKLIDLTGKVLRSGDSVSSNFFIHRNGLPSGVYWCKFRLENGATALGRVVFD